MPEMACGKDSSWAGKISELEELSYDTTSEISFDKNLNAYLGLVVS